MDAFHHLDSFVAQQTGVYRQAQMKAMYDSDDIVDIECRKYRTACDFVREVERESLRRKNWSAKRRTDDNDARSRCVKWTSSLSDSAAISSHARRPVDSSRQPTITRAPSHRVDI